MKRHFLDLKYSYLLYSGIFAPSQQSKSCPPSSSPKKRKFIITVTITIIPLLTTPLPHNKITPGAIPFVSLWFGRCFDLDLALALASVLAQCIAAIEFILVERALCPG